MSEQMTMADVRRMLKGLPPLNDQAAGEAIPPTPTPAPQPDASPDASLAVDAVPSDLSGLDLSDEQQADLRAAGYADRATLAAAVASAGDKGISGISRETVRRLRKQLGG